MKPKTVKTGASESTRTKNATKYMQTNFAKELRQVRSAKAKDISPKPQVKTKVAAAPANKVIGAVRNSRFASGAIRASAGGGNQYTPSKVIGFFRSKEPTYE